MLFYSLHYNAAITKPPTPTSLNSALRNLVGTVANFITFPNNLQRAMLWDAGLVQAIPTSGGSTSGSNGSVPNVQVYVECGRTMSGVFLSSQALDNSTSCELKSCKSNAISFTKSTCDPSYIETKTSCAVSPETGSWNSTLQQSDGPLWSMDGQIDESFNPQLLQYNDSGGNTTIFMLAQQSSWVMNDDTCPNGAQFIVPCREVSAAEVADDAQERVWCEPELELSIMTWVDSGTLATTSTSERLSTSAIVGITCACVFVLLFMMLVGFVIVRRHRSGANQGQTGLWNDDIITANRIPREKVRVLKLISRGAFGEVYGGIYNGGQVAIKMLLPSTRRDIKLVNEFLSEARLTATMEHPRIVALIGVAWDSLSDLCVVLEFMAGHGKYNSQ